MGERERTAGGGLSTQCRIYGFAQRQGLGDPSPRLSGLSGEPFDQSGGRANASSMRPAASRKEGAGSGDATAGKDDDGHGEGDGGAVGLLYGDTYGERTGGEAGGRATEGKGV